MLKEWNQRCCHRNDLRGRNVHELHTLGARQGEFISIPAGNQFIGQLTLAVQPGIRLGDHVSTFFDRREVDRLIGHLPVDHLAVRCLQKAVFVRPREESERVDQTDVRAFRRLDGADTAVMGGMDIAYLKARAFAGQSTWA